MSYKIQELLTLREHLSSPPIFVGARVAHLFSFLCCLVFSCLLVYVLCLVCTVLPVCLIKGLPSVFRWVRVARSLVFCGVFCGSLFVLFLLTIVLSILWFTALITPLVSSNFWPLYCLSFFDLRLWLPRWYLQTFLNTLFILQYYNDLYRFLFQKSEATVYKSAWPSPIHFCLSGCV